MSPSPGPPLPPRPPYWTLLALAGLLLLPGPAAVALGVGALGLLALRTIPGMRERRRLEREAPGGPGAVTLGRDASGRPVGLAAPELAAHGLILGASGAGKSTTLLRLLGQRVAAGLPVLAVDLKGSPSFAGTLHEAAAAAGRPFVVWTPDGPSHWNPLGRGNATELKDKLIAGERFSEPHYQRAAERYLQNVLAVLLAAHPERRPRLEEVVALSEPQRLAATLRHVPEPLRARVQDYLGSIGPDQVSAARGLGTRLAVLTESHTGPYLGPGPPGTAEIDIGAALRGPEVVLFSLNSSSYGKLAAQLGTMVIQDVVAAAGRRLAGDGHGPPPPVLVAIDEFSALGADHVIALLARGRESGVSVLVATQELADLDRAATGLREQVLGNTAVKIIHRQDVPASARMVAEMSGVRWEWEETRQFGGSPRTGIGPRGSRRQVRRPVVAPDQVAALPTGRAVLISKVPRMVVRTVQVGRPRAPARPAPPAREGPER